jgi:hypothetical protein
MFHYETDYITSFIAKIGTSGSSYIFSTHCNMNDTIYCCSAQGNKASIGHRHICCFHWRHDTQQNDIQQNDTQHKVLYWDTQHKWHSAIMLSVVMLGVVMLSYVMLRVLIYLLQYWMSYAECHCWMSYAECHMLNVICCMSLFWVPLW